MNSFIQSLSYSFIFNRSTPFISLNFIARHPVHLPADSFVRLAQFVCPFHLTRLPVRRSRNLSKCSTSLWSRIAKNPDGSTGPEARPFARSLIRPQRSLFHLPCPASFAHALRCAHSFVRLFTHSLLSLWQRGFCP